MLFVISKNSAQNTCLSLKNPPLQSRHIGWLVARWGSTVFLVCAVFFFSLSFSSFIFFFIFCCRRWSAIILGCCVAVRGEISSTRRQTRPQQQQQQQPRVLARGAVALALTLTLKTGLIEWSRYFLVIIISCLVVPSFVEVAAAAGVRVNINRSNLYTLL